MSIYTQICIFILLCIAIYYIAKLVMISLLGVSSFCAIQAAKELDSTGEQMYQGALALIKSGKKIPIYSNAYFVFSGTAEKYHKGELGGYYFLVFFDGDIALYNGDAHNCHILTSIWRTMINKLLKEAGYTSEDVQYRIEQEKFYYEYGPKAFASKFNIQL